MSRVKKTVSILLAAVMVLTMAPFASALVYQANEAGTKFNYDTASNVVNPTPITVDTYGTTETLRTCDQTHSLLDGLYIVSANSSGTPIVEGTFANFAYGMETPTAPQVVLKINGISDTSLISNLGIACTDINNFSAGNAASTTTGGNNPSITYTWTLPGNKTMSVNQSPRDIVYNITFTYAKKTYTVHAYSRAENVVRPSGLLRVGKWDPSGDSKHKMFAHLTQLYCAQSVPGFAGTGGDHSYFDYSVSVTSGNALSGGGFDDTGKGTVIVQADANNNNDIGGLAWFRNEYKKADWVTWENGWLTPNPDNAEAKYRPRSANGDCPRLTVYVDTAYDHLGTGTSGGKTNGLNMRMVWKTTDKGGNYPQKVCFMEAIAVRNSATIQGENFVLGGSTASTGSASTGTMTVDLSHVYHDGSGYNNLNNLSTQGRKSNGTGGYVNADGDTLGSNFVMHTFGGTGALSSGTVWCIDYLIKSTQNSSVEDNHYLKSTNSMQVRFNTYTTATLRSALNAIDTGVVSNINGTSFGSKGALPQSWMYSGGWSDFESAYNTARKVIAKFRTSQSEINNALDSLRTAYEGLAGYVPSGTFNVKHVVEGTNEDLVPMQTFTHTGNWGSTSGAAIANGAAVTLHALSNVVGYEPSGSASFAGFVSFNSDGAVLADEDGNTYGNTYTFYYKPAKISLAVHTGYYEYDEDDVQHEIILTKQVTNGSNLNSSSSDPNFSTIKSEILGNSWQPDYTTYGGIYTSSSFSGSPIDGINVSTGATTWNMPATATPVYVKWEPVAVKLKVITSYGATETEIASPVVPTSSGAPDYNMGSVTFNMPANPPASAGMEFVNYYKDSAYTEPVEWPITADYYGTSDYNITEGTGVNYVTVYAKYVDLTDKIVFDAGNGTLDDCTTPLGFTVADGVLDYSAQFTGATVSIDYPVPTREGYTFDGWVDANGNAIQGWTQGSASTGYAPVPNGVTVHASHTGFIAYAVWEAQPITITFYHDIDAGETSIMNSHNVPGQNFYYQMDVAADSQVNTEYFPSNPRRFGYEFQYWTIDGRRFDTTGRYPTSDTSLIAKWTPAPYRLFSDLTSYVSLDGANTAADLQHAPDTATTPVAMKGDKVKIQFNAGGTFYAASTSWIFAYDADFFSEIDNVKVAKVNDANSYVEGLGGANDENIFVAGNSVAYAAYNSAMGTVTDPYTNAAVSNPGYVQVVIDPYLEGMTNYNTVGFEDTDNYLIEVTLKIKDDTTKTQGSFWLPEQLVRTPENLMGDTFVAYAPSARSIREVETDKVQFENYPVTTVKVLDETRPLTTVTAALPVENGVTLGEFADGTTASKSFTGPEGTEILATYTVNGTAYFDEWNGTGTPTAQNIMEEFPTPVREGYHIAGWYNGSDETDSWSTNETNDGPADVYSYANEDQDGKTYTVKWEPDEFTLFFYNDRDLTDLRTSVNVVYDQRGLQSIPRVPSGASSTFLGWIPAGMEPSQDNVVDFTLDTGYHVMGDASFYAWTLPAQKEFQLQFRTYDGEDEIIVGAFNMTKEAQTALGLELRIGDTFKIVNEIPATPENGVQYLTYADLQAIYAGTYTYDNDGTTATLAPMAVPNAWKLHADATYSDTAAVRSNYIVNSSASNQLAIVSTLPAAIASAAANDASVIYIALSPNPNTEVRFRVSSNANQGPQTVDPNSGYVLDGTFYIKTISGTYGTPYDANAQLQGIYRKGYNAKFQNPDSNLGTYVGGSLYNINFITNPANVTYHFMGENGTTEISTHTETGGTSSGGYARQVSITSTAPQVTKDGYTFQGWFIADKAPSDTAYSIVGTTDQTSIKPSTAGAEVTDHIIETNTNGVYSYDIYLMPKFTVNTYPVKYYAVYADSYAATAQVGQTQNVEYGTTYTVNGAATAPDGYTFDGWYGSSDYSNKGTQITSFTMDNFDHNLYGFYVPNTYPATFYNNYEGADPAEFATLNPTYHAAISAPETNPVRAGYDFAGWGTTADAAESDAIDFANNAPVLNSTDGAEYFAIWTPKAVQYNIEYYIEKADSTGYDIAATETDTGTVGTEVTLTSEQKNAKLSENPGFFLDDNAAGKVYTGTIPAEGTFSFKVYMSRVSYTIEFDTTGGTPASIASVTAKYGSDISTLKPADPTKEGYSFTGWSPDYPATMPLDGYTGANALKATWEKNKYLFTVDLNAADAAFATGDSDPSGEYYFEAPIPQLNNPQRTGYTFTGWDVTYPTTMPAAAVTVTAQWQINTYTVTVNPNGGSIANLPAGWVESNGNYVFTGDYGATVPSIAAPVREGYFLTTDWATAIPATVPINPAPITASWQLEIYRIALNAGDGTVAKDTREVAYGQTTTFPDAVLEGYDFSGWFTAAQGGEQYTSATVIGDLGNDVSADSEAISLTLYAQYSKHEYNIVYDVNGGTPQIPATTAAYADVINLPTDSDVAKEGFSFTGWKVGNDVFTGTYTVPALENNGDTITFVAQWEVNPYTITVDPNGGSIANLPAGWETVDGKYVFEGDYGTAVPELNNPSRTGYDFANWSEQIPANVPATDKQITASWTKHSYRIEYNLNGGAPQIAATTAEFESVINLPTDADVSNTGHTFSGWSDGNGTYTGTYTVPAQPRNGDTIILTAQWDINEYKITVDPNGGSIANLPAGWVENAEGKYVFEDEYGAAVTPLTAPVRTGYDPALNWNANIPEYVPAGDVNVTINWTEHKYDVVFVQPDNSTGDPTFNNLTPYEDYTMYDVSFNSAMNGTPAEAPVVTYYEFAFWSTDAGTGATAIADITTWTPADYITDANDAAIRADGNRIVIYPHYTRIEVTLTLETTSDAVITDRDATEEVAGYIYGAGSKLKKADFEDQLVVLGQGSVEIIPSMGTQICGTGTKVILHDDYYPVNDENNIVAVYYLIVPGDVNGDAACNANDVNIAKHTLRQPEASRDWYLKDAATDTAEQLAEKARKRTCAELASDVSEQYGVFNSDDVSMMELFVFRAVDYTFDKTEVRYSTAERT